MTAKDFRTLALSLPEAVEQAHMGHPDFRVRNKIFATLGPDEDWAMVKLTPAQQSSFVGREPGAFAPFNGAWGKRGCTRVILVKAKKRVVREALFAAWSSTAPKDVINKHTEE